MDVNYSAVLPEIVLSLAGITLMLLAPFTRRERQAPLGWAAAAAIGLALVCLLATSGTRGQAFFGMLLQDGFGDFCRALFLLASGAVVLVSVHYLQREDLARAEFYSLVLFATVGMCLMATSADLIMTFLGLEVLSISTYIMAGFKEGELKSAESAIKYFILGAFSTAFLLYGAALVYGVTGSTRYPSIAAALARLDAFPAALLAGLGLIAVGFAFKAALVPFHVWTPDVYEGAPLPVTAHLAVGSKAAAFVALLRILYQVMPDMSLHWQGLLWISAAATMLLGNLAALTQNNIKRMLAYSSIAHAGYLLVGLAAHNHLGVRGVLFYLAAYAAMSLGAFAVVQVFGRRDESYLAIEDYAGAGFRHPFLSVTLSAFLISLAGIPATAGFMGKLFLFSAAVESELYALVVIALIASAVGLYYYLRVIVVMFMSTPDLEGESIPIPGAVRLVIAVTVVFTFYFGILPGRLLELADKAVSF